MRARLTLAAGTAALALAGSVFAASPAFALCTPPSGGACGDTTVAFTVNAGTLAIVTSPAAVGTPSQSIVGTTAEVDASLGLTTVTDTRVAGNGWVVSASSTAFAPTSGASISSSAAKYYVPGALTNVLGTHTLSAGATTAVSAVAAGAPLVTDVGSGINTASFTPSVRIDLPVGTQALAYTGTVTQSVV